jgi:S1-C subfamily serine protease
LAAKAGLEVADIIVAANGEPILTIQALQMLLYYSKRGDAITLDVIRNKKLRKIELVL